MISLTPLQTWAALALAVIGIYLFNEMLQRLTLVMDYGPADDEELDVDPYDRDMDPHGYIDEETDWHRDKQVTDDAIESENGR
ncbi:hypothetical protein [Pseudoclavibacter sp. 8L]|uniref:hypothetical protein n=1 Tax=Pseudoclavibacter sp. 8L TaxID=2653162 RepID=UPI0012F38C38|nr:hypothetical protein [Pseudoclavibacter sp. 8L]VXB76500.1 conserved hypothetical protein [Pseudoclavibacter sp. 8L]